MPLPPFDLRGLRKIVCSMVLGFTFAAASGAFAQGAGYWHTSGSTILDANNQQIRIAGINWYGFESGTATISGLYAQDYKAILTTIKSQGYNTIRVPLSSQMIEAPAAVLNINYSNASGAINTDLRGLNSLQVLDKIVDYAGTLGLKIILDHHRSDAGASAEGNGLWFTAEFSEASWIKDWVNLANRYLGNPTVIGFDLHNEPHLAGTAGACWDCGGPNDWHLAAERAGNAVLGVNPNLLIFVEGVNVYGTDWTWWGGNLEGVAKSPVVLSVPNRLVYSAHDYGPNVSTQPWFSSTTTYAGLASTWNQYWGYLVQNKVAPVWVGEFGTTNSPSDLKNSAPGTQGQWFQSLVQYLSSNPDVGWSYWAVNGEDPLSLLNSNYDAVPVSPTKQAMLASIQFPLVTSTTPPAAPAGLSASAISVSQVNLKWNAVTAPGVTYDVYFGTTSGNTATLLTSGLTTTSYQVSNLNCCTLYYFTVRASSQGKLSAASNQASVSTKTPSVPAAPSSLTAAAISATTINLGWVPSATAGVTYTIYSGSTSGTVVKAIANSVTTSAYSVAGLNPSTTYYFEVKAVGQGGTSPASKVASAQTKSLTVPAAPGKLTAVAGSPTQVNLTWAASTTSGVTYNVYASATANGTPALLASGVSSTSFQATSLKTATTYFFTVRAAASNLLSPASNTAAATTASSASGASCHVTYSDSSDWASGFVANLSITNLASTPLSAWKLTWSYSGNQRITQSWGSSFAQNGQAVSLTNLGYNSALAAGATVSGIGFQGSYSGKNVAPAAFYLNGVLCK